jgi:hypothetical protein
MLVKVNSISKRSDIKDNNRISKAKQGEEQYNIQVTKLDIDDLGSIVPLKEMVLLTPSYDKSIIETLKISHYAAIFTKDDDEDDESIIILANGITEEELNKDKERTIASANPNKNGNR